MKTACTSKCAGCSKITVSGNSLYSCISYEDAAIQHRIAGRSVCPLCDGSAAVKSNAKAKKINPIKASKRG